MLRKLQRTDRSAAPWMGVLVLPVALSGCVMGPPPVAVVCSPSPVPSTVALRQTESRGYTEGYGAGELAQALRDQTRVRLAMEALAAQQGEQPASLPTPPPADSFTFSGPAKPVTTTLPPL